MVHLQYWDIYYAFQSKLKAKTGGLKYQWQIMAAMGFSNEEIKPFCDPMHWLIYFPPKAKSDLTRMGIKVQCSPEGKRKIRHTIKDKINSSRTVAVIQCRPWSWTNSTIFITIAESR